MTRTHFFLVFEGRAGSGLLRAIMNSSPRIEFEAEWMMFDLKKEEGAGAAQVRQISRFFTDEQYASIAALGFANKLSDIVDRPAFADALQAHGVKVISLKRRNLAKQAFSIVNAIRNKKVTGRYHAYSSQDLLHDSFELDLDRFDAVLTRLVHRTYRQDRYVRDRDWEWTEVFYEDLVLDKANTVRRLARFLAVDDAALDLEPRKAPLKQTPTDLRRSVTNFDALRQRYAGSHFQPMIEDPRL